MQTVLLVIHIFITVALVGVILMQRSGTDGLAGMGGGGGGGNFMTGRGAANALTKTTAILATLFIANSLLLAIIASRSEQNTSIIDKIISQDPAVIEQPVNTGQNELPSTKEESPPIVPLAE